MRWPQVITAVFFGSTIFLQGTITLADADRSEIEKAMRSAMPPEAMCERRQAYSVCKIGGGAVGIMKFTITPSTRHKYFQVFWFYS